MKSPKEIGEILSQARQKKGLTIEKVYKATRIQPKIIGVLEEGKADEVLSRIYVLLFLKKYASFLDLNSDSLTTDYKTFYTDREEQILDVIKEPVAININRQKWMTLAISVGVIFIFVFSALFLSIKLKSFYRTRKKAASIAAPKAIPKEVPKDRTQIIFPISKDKPIELALQSTSDVWMKVKKDGKVIFEGTLRKNAKKKWSARKSLELWVGRAQALKLSINGKPVGRIGKGKIKSIQISRRGLKVGNKWLLKAE